MAKHSIGDINVKGLGFNAKVDLAKYGHRLEEAERWVEAEIVRKMLPIMPRDTGNLIGTIQSVNSVLNGSGKVRAAHEYGVYLYEGISKSGAPFNWTNPQTQPRWGHYVIDTYRSELKDGVKEILNGGTPNGG